MSMNEFEDWVIPLSIIFKQKFTLAILFASVSPGLKAFECGRRFPSLIRRCTVAVDKFSACAIPLIVVRLRRGINLILCKSN